MANTRAVKDVPVDHRCFLEHLLCVPTRGHVQTRGSEERAIPILGGRSSPGLTWQ